MSIVGQRIKYLRERCKWSQIQLAEKLGIHNTVLSRIESGEKKSVDNYLISKAADVFEVTTDFLLGKTDNPAPYWTKKVTISEEHASYLDVEGLTDAEIEEVKKHIAYLKWKALHPEK
ncbi:helix-turn-helix domain-containing protein [Brevibacillus ruminantium]|uniref:Helix-turn-helix domain-containing protein n=1 Tax=Brevibacillus ruminantium TaxID=2950604 RepID=A0ABY4WFJ5_9BACL|nr:helix-turn-helix transcriptional regulator [Brevibacillus ruminantium]USG65842.1 helix-turn-helix domain-containing protein [Brevibacillus ruminantium]